MATVTPSSAAGNLNPQVTNPTTKEELPVSPATPDDIPKAEPIQPPQVIDPTSPYADLPKETPTKQPPKK